MKTNEVVENDAENKRDFDCQSNIIPLTSQRTPNTAEQLKTGQTTPNTTPETTPATPKRKRPGGPLLKKNTVLPAASFEFRGGNYRIYKKRPAEAAPWYYEYQVGKKRFPTHLDTHVLSAAVEKAKLIITARDMGRDEELAK